MRVTIVSKAFVVGAYQRKLEALAAQPDIELTAVVPSSWREGDRVQRLERVYTNGYRLIETQLRFNGSFHLHFYPQLASIMRALQPEICHIDEEPYNLATWLAVRAAMHYQARPLFFTWQNLNRHYPWPFRALERGTYRHCRAAICGNAEAAAVLRDKGYFGRIALIPQFGVDPDLFTPAALRSTGPFTIGYAGRLVEQKGLLVLAQALQRLEGDWRLEISGTGPLQPALEAALQVQGMAERVRFHQHIPSAEMPAFYQGLNVLVLPSLTRPNWKEQFGRVLIEAMACGVPVIGSDSGEIPRVIGAAGIITPEGDVQALAAQLARLRVDGSLHKRLRVAGRDRVLTHYTHNRIAADTAAVYRWLAQDTDQTPAWDIASKVI